jgi:hypothetical protein
MRCTIVLCLGAAVAIIASGCGDSGRATYTVGKSSWASSWPRQPARPADVGRATRIADRDPEVRKIVGVRGAPSGSFVWLTAHNRAPVVVLRLPLRTAVRVDVVVPYAVNPPDAPASGDCQQPYAPGWKRIRAHHVTRLFVAVDLARSSVADISTDADREVVSPVTGRPFPQCEAKESDR